MTITDGDVLKVVAQLLLSDGTIAQNVFHYLAELTSDQTDTAVLDALEVFVEDFYGAMEDEISDDVTMDLMNVDVVEWDETESKWKVVQNVGERTPTVTFLNTVDVFPNQVAATMLAYTAHPRVKGRKFIPGFSDNQADAGDLITSALTAMGNALAEYLADITISAGNTLSPGVPRTESNIFRKLGSGLINSVLGTQRRRKPGIGA
jgi:hypothetical protein